MIKQPSQTRDEKETASDIGSSLANIGMAVKSRDYDAVFPYPNDKIEVDDKISGGGSVDTEEMAKNAILLDGDATPKVSRVSRKI